MYPCWLLYICPLSPLCQVVVEAILEVLEGWSFVEQELRLNIPSWQHDQSHSNSSLCSKFWLLTFYLQWTFIAGISTIALGIMVETAAIHNDMVSLMVWREQRGELVLVVLDAPEENQWAYGHDSHTACRSGSFSAIVGSSSLISIYMYICVCIYIFIFIFWLWLQMNTQILKYLVGFIPSKGTEWRLHVSLLSQSLYLM